MSLLGVPGAVWGAEGLAYRRVWEGLLTQPCHAISAATGTHSLSLYRIRSASRSCFALLSGADEVQEPVGCSLKAAQLNDPADVAYGSQNETALAVERCTQHCAVARRRAAPGD